MVADAVWREGSRDSYNRRVVALISPAVVRDAVSRRAFSELADRLRAAGPQALAETWPKLAPLEALACWRLLSAHDARVAAPLLPKDGRWLAYMGAPLEALAPLLEDAPLGARRLFRRPSTRETALLRKSLS